MKYTHIFFVPLLLGLLCSMTFADSPYNSWSTNDFKALALTAVGGATSLYLDSQIQPLTEEKVRSLSPENVNGFDRVATRLTSETAATISDWGMRTSLLLPLGLLASERVRNDGKTAALLYFETMAITGVLTELCKTAVQRIRPYAYNEDVDLGAKLGKDTKKSFFSGHTSASFAGALLFAKLYSDYYPNSSWKPYVWTGSLAIATTVGYARVRAGRHFPTDVIAGALVGGAVAYLVPELHKIRQTSLSATSADASSMMVNLRFSF